MVPMKVKQVASNNNFMFKLEPPETRGSSKGPRSVGIEQRLGVFPLQYLRQPTTSQ